MEFVSKRTRTMLSYNELDGRQSAEVVAHKTDYSDGASQCFVRAVQDSIP
jgi:hypothetical protein